MQKVFAALIALSFLVLFGYACVPDDIVVEDVRFVDGASDAKLYYPKDITSLTPATTMSAGYTQTLSNVEWLSESLAKEGFIVLGLTPDNTFGMVNNWRQMHKGGIAKLKELNNNHNVLRGLIDTGKLQTCGHSKGGGGSLWASSELQGDLDTTIAMAPYCGGEFNMNILRDITSPTFIQAGSSDTLATNSMTRDEYASLSSSISRRYAEYSGYGHLAWDGATGSTAGRISGDIIAWMRYYMDGDTSYAGTLSNSSGTSRHEWVDLSRQ